MLDPRDLELTSHLVQGQRIVGTQLLPSPLRNAHLPLQAPSLGMAARRQTHSFTLDLEVYSYLTLSKVKEYAFFLGKKIYVIVC